MLSYLVYVFHRSTLVSSPSFAYKLHPTRRINIYHLIKPEPFLSQELIPVSKFLGLYGICYKEGE
ncbi:hypothetical protein G9C98_006072 [Cotesia typhae]|uniref:Uncharacterized protein n=1 Tax=Cotesia typhae TaxID=2053667 RepID=A0A8J5UYP8_9HYME|nr:hypothetical protein G9C98_006072 [Cotesia typhae]